MKKFKCWLLQRITELDRLYAHPDPHEDVWRGRQPSCMKLGIERPVWG